MFSRAGISGTLLILLLLTTHAAAETSQAATEPSSLDFANGLYARKMYAPAISEYQKFIQENPKSEELASALFRLADSYYFSKKYKDSIKNFQDFIQKFPDEKRVPVARFRIGTAYVQSRQFAEAEKALFALAAQAQDPTVRSGSLFYLAKSYEGQGNSQRMATVLKRLVLNYPQTEYAAYSAFTLAELAAKENNSKEAENYYKGVAERTTPKALADQARLRLAEIYFDRKNYEAAHTFYAALHASLKEDTRPDVSLLNKATLGILYCDYYQKKTDEAMDFFKANETRLVKTAEQYPAYYLMAEIYSAAGQNNDALALLDRIIQSKEAEVSLRDSALFRKSRLLADSSKKEEALGELQKIIDSESKDAPKAYFEKGNLLFDMGKFEEAQAYYKMAAEESSVEYQRLGLYGLGMSDLKKGDKKQAHAHFLNLTMKYPDSGEAERAWLEMIQIDIDAENFKEAAMHSYKFLEQYPKSGFLDIAHYKLGMSLTSLGQFKQAGFQFAAIVKNYPKSTLYAEALYAAAASFDKAIMPAQAIPYYERFLKELPNHNLYAEALGRLGFVYTQNADFEKAANVYRDILLNRKNIELNSKIAMWLVRYDLDKGHLEEVPVIVTAMRERYVKENLAHETEYFLGEWACLKKNYAEALGHYKKAVEIKTDGPYAPHSYLGMGLANKASGNKEEALKNFSEASRFDTAVDIAARAKLESGILQQASGDLQEAAKSFMLVAILYDDAKYSAEALYRAADCFNKLGQTDEAIKAADELKNRYPNSEWIKK